MKNIGFRAPPAPRKNDRTNWCGPFVLATLCAGMGYEGAEKLLRSVRPEIGRQAIKGVYTSTLVAALLRSGFIVSKLPVRPWDQTGKPVTLTQWYKRRPHKTSCYLVEAGRHFMLVNGAKFIDNQSDGWVPFHALRRFKRAHVRSVHLIWLN